MGDLPLVRLPTSARAARFCGIKQQSKKGSHCFLQHQLPAPDTLIRVKQSAFPVWILV